VRLPTQIRCTSRNATTVAPVLVAHQILPTPLVTARRAPKTAFSCLIIPNRSGGTTSFPPPQAALTTKAVKNFFAPAIRTEITICSASLRPVNHQPIPAADRLLIFCHLFTCCPNKTLALWTLGEVTAAENPRLSFRFCLRRSSSLAEPAPRNFLPAA
jgi:hypothetical protein